MDSIPAVPGTLKATEARLYELANLHDVVLRAAILVADHHKLSPTHQWAFVALVMRDRAAELLAQNVELARMQPPPVLLVPPEAAELERVRAERDLYRDALHDPDLWEYMKAERDRLRAHAQRSLKCLLEFPNTAHPTIRAAIGALRAAIGDAPEKGEGERPMPPPPPPPGAAEEAKVPQTAGAEYKAAHEKKINQKGDQ